MPPSDTPPYHHGNLRDAALRAAEALLCDAGEDAVTMREVARAVGVTHRALYRWFAEREALLAALAAEGFDGLARAVSEAVAAAPEAKQAAFVRAYLEYARARAPLYRVAMSRSRAALKAYPALQAATDRMVAASLATFRNVEAEPRDFIIALWAMLHGLVSLMDAGLLAARDDAAIVAYGLRLSERIVAIG